MTCALGPASASALRQADPVVLTGADLPTLIGAAPGSIVAFSRSDGAWEQVPVQVDERLVVDLGPVFKNPPEGVTTLTYADPGTLTGPDPDPILDPDDEIALMARDAGASTTAAPPAGVAPNSGVEVAVTDPLDSGAAGSVYLFRSETLDPGAGQRYVDYTFKLLSGDYKTTYKFGGTQGAGGPNPEDSSVVTPFYRAHYSDRWVQDGMQVTTAGSSGVDILDRHKNQFAPGTCARSEDTFSNGEGAFIVNKSGPVRAIRAYIGANSGPYTQRTEIFYDRRQDIRTNLRVHTIGRIMDFYDYSPAASGMTYRNPQNPAGLTIDGVPDPGFVAGPPLYEQVAGPQGAISMVSSLDTDMNVTLSSYRLDDSTPNSSGPEIQCTGDDFAYGASGAYLTSGVDNTDPRLPNPRRLVSDRIIFFETPDVGPDQAAKRQGEVLAPLRVQTKPMTVGGRAATRLRLKMHRGRKIVLAGTVCGGESKPKVILQRRTKQGKWARVRGLGLKAGKGDCFKLQTRLVRAKAIYRVKVAEESTRDSATSRALKVGPAGN